MSLEHCHVDIMSAMTLISNVIMSTINIERAECQQLSLGIPNFYMNPHSKVYILFSKEKNKQL